VLAARLRPAPGAQPAFARFKRTRRALRHSYADRFGGAGRMPYVPHVTLGYLANRPAARRARRLLGEEAEAIAREAREERLPLSHVRLYAFTDMATFVCGR
jgi:2'-5' RNA ligase